VRRELHMGAVNSKTDAKVEVPAASDSMDWAWPVGVIEITKKSAAGCDRDRTEARPSLIRPARML
jgi:hypothetical protein